MLFAFPYARKIAVAVAKRIKKSYNTGMNHHRRFFAEKR